MSAQNQRAQGQMAEDLAAEHLRRLNFVILERNYRLKFGEIDIIARDGDTVCFVEVKMRRTLSYGTPFEAVPRLKMQKLVRVAMAYLASRRLNGCNARFDVVAVMPGSATGLRVQVLKDAFRLDEAGGY